MSVLQFHPLGDRAVTIELGSSIDEPTHRRVRAVCARLEAAPIAGMEEYVPAFASVAVYYDPSRLAPAAASTTRSAAGGASAYERVRAALGALLADVGPDAALPPPRDVTIPVCYGGALGPDLVDVARHHGLSADDVVAIHSAAEYVVYMLGFTPGFAYLGGLPERLATPRRPVPRAAVPAASVGIGGSQTGIYPIASPGGWHLIGRTPLRLFAAERDPPTLLQMGDRVRFEAISPNEFDRWERGR